MWNPGISGEPTSQAVMNDLAPLAVLIFAVAMAFLVRRVELPRIGERLGVLIGRDTLDPNLPLDPMRDKIFLDALLAEARNVENPFVASTEDLEEQGFEGAPYSATP